MTPCVEMSEPEASEAGSLPGGQRPTKGGSTRAFPFAGRFLRGMQAEVPGVDELEKFLTFQREVNRLFRRIFEEGSSPRPMDGDGLAARANVAELDGELVVEIETPGVPRESLSLEVSRDLIVVEGERARRGETGSVRFHALERETGRFRRILEIPCPVDTRGIRARYDAGLLTITLPKIEDRRGERRKVPIESAPKRPRRA